MQVILDPTTPTRRSEFPQIVSALTKTETVIICKEEKLHIPNPAHF